MSAALHLALLSAPDPGVDGFAQALSLRLRAAPLALRVRIVANDVVDGAPSDEADADVVLHSRPDAGSLGECSGALLLLGHATPAHVEDALRALLMAGNVRWSVVRGGLDAVALESALDAITPWLLQGRRPATASGLFSRLQARQAAQPAWTWVCDSCDSPECEHASLRERRARGGTEPTPTDD